MTDLSRTWALVAMVKAKEYGDQKLVHGIVQCLLLQDYQPSASPVQDSRCGKADVPGLMPYSMSTRGFRRVSGWDMFVSTKVHASTDIQVYSIWSESWILPVVVAEVHSIIDRQYLDMSHGYCSIWTNHLSSINLTIGALTLTRHPIWAGTINLHQRLSRR